LDQALVEPFCLLLELLRFGLLAALKRSLQPFWDVFLEDCALLWGLEACDKLSFLKRLICTRACDLLNDLILLSK
jgi:hypothetical protein